MLAAYLDESGGTDTTVLVIAGCLSTTQRWTRYERDWRKALNEFGIQFFHMREAAHLQGQFKGWSTRRRDALLKRLVYLIKESAPTLVSVAVDVAGYRELLPIIKGARPYSDSPFFIAFQSTLSNLVDAARQGKQEEKVALVFDHNADYARPALSLYSKFKEWGYPFADGLGPISFADDKDVTPLQAADLIAWESLKYARETRDSRQRPMRASLASLTELEVVSKYWNRAQLLELKRGLETKLVSEKSFTELNPPGGTGITF